MLWNFLKGSNFLTLWPCQNSLFLHCQVTPPTKRTKRAVVSPLVRLVPCLSSTDSLVGHTLPAERRLAWQAALWWLTWCHLLCPLFNIFTSIYSCKLLLPFRSRQLCSELLMQLHLFSLEDRYVIQLSSKGWLYRMKDASKDGCIGWRMLLPV